MERLGAYSVDPNTPEQFFSLLESILVNKAMRTGAPRHTPLSHAMWHVIRLGARCIIHQSKVNDPDFTAEHAAYYSRWSTKVPRHCDRLHFFNIEPKSADPLEVIDQMAASDDSYLGFITLRPVSMSPVAATILRPLKEERVHFLLSCDEFKVNLAGQTFLIIGTPFMQQDNAVGACAQASIWMALRTLRRKEGHAAFSPAQITIAATRFLVNGRTLPNRQGLRIEQVTEAVRAAGYAPHLIPLRNIDDSPTAESLDYAKRALYPYVESGIPVLLLLFKSKLEGHAVLLIGHGWTPVAPRLIVLGQLLGKIDLYDASSWIEPFFIHNDNTGPYLPLPENDAESYALSHAVSAIPFLHPDVFIDGAEAQKASLQLLGKTLASNGQDLKIDTSKLVVRTYLQDKAVFRRAILESDMPIDVKAYYRKKWLPKRVWVTELNMLDNYGKCPEGKAVRLGEILLDPSSEPEDGHFLTIHIEGALLTKDEEGRGVIIDRDAFDETISASPVAGNKYSPLVRKTS